MTAQTLPDNPNYCFVPAYDIEDEVKQIRIVIEGMSGYVPTALVALTVKRKKSAIMLNRQPRTEPGCLDRACGAVHARRGGRPRQRLALRPETSHYSEITPNPAISANSFAISAASFQ